MQSLTVFHYRLLFCRFIVALVLFQVSRILFLLLNPNTYEGNIADLFIASLRYDVTAIAILFIPVLLLHIYPSRLNNHHLWQKSISTLIILIIAPSLLLNCVDAAWFAYSQKRSTTDLFLIIGTGNDLGNNLADYLLDFWYVPAFWLFLVGLVFCAESRFRKSVVTFSHTNSPQLPLPARIALPVLLIGIEVIGFRGGFQLKPLSIQAAARMVPQSAIPLVLNTPYTFMKSVGQSAIHDPQYLTLQEARKIFPVERSMTADSTRTTKNLIIIVMESFSFEYISYYHPGKSTTPFLDSLMKNAECWPNTFANAKRSIEGIPAVLASLPHLMDQPFINSAYNITNINSPASILQSKGYTSGFFHGGNNGTMGFDNFSRLCGYQKYYGRNEYKGSESDYDGNWGISDHAFFHFMIEEINTWKPPFTAAFFSLSSHHPYFIPPAYQNQIPENISPVEKSIYYADLSLRRFFNEAKLQPWYDNTVFIITSDHSGPAETPYTAGRLGAYHIPIIIVDPSNGQPETHPEIAQQTDILPTALYLCGYTGKFSAFGRNLYESRNGWSVNYSNNSWSVINDEYVLLFDGDEATHVFSRNDTLLSRNNIQQLIKLPAVRSSEGLLKAIIKQYNYGLIHNALLTRHEKTPIAD